MDPISNPLASAAGMVCVQVEPVQSEGSLRAAVREMAELGLNAVPVVDGTTYVGVVTEASVRSALASGSDVDEPVSQFLDRAVPVVNVGDSGAETLRRMEAAQADCAVVLDAEGGVQGVLVPSRFVTQVHDRSFRGRIGGMATPFGVYLTNGTVSGGVGPVALVVTGMVMGTVFVVSGTLSLWLAAQLPAPFARSSTADVLVQALWMLFFLVGLRLLPLAGIHAAEHMVVHAIELGESLQKDTVRRMPRVHPRCGTNLAVAASLFLGLMSAPWIPYQDLRLVVSLLVTVLLWVPLGNFVQAVFTTRPPTEAQLELGIAAGRDFVRNARMGLINNQSGLRRLAMSGVFQVFVGASTVLLALNGLYEVLKVPAWIRVT